MSGSENWSDKVTRLVGLYQARRAASKRSATGFVSQPEPRTIGSFAKGRQLVAGNFLFAGFLVEAPETSIWDIPMPDPAFEEELHGFAWLDDLAAVGDLPARERAQNWLNDWIKTYGTGQGPGWSPDLTGRRLIRWINHALFLLNGGNRAGSKAYFESLTQQVIFLSKRWHIAASGLPRFEALTGLIYAGLGLTGMEDLVEPAVKALSRDCESQINEEGGIPTRNPEELLEVFTLLTWAASALSEAGRMPSKSHLAAIERIAPTLRALRHADGSLARFHGGGRGLEGRLDQALAASGIRGGAHPGLSMGYARMSGGRTSVIVDASAPPERDSSANAHASTLAFELTSGRRPVIVNCGSGISFGPTWRRAGRATPSHSALVIEGYSSSRVVVQKRRNQPTRELLADIPSDVRVEQVHDVYGSEYHGIQDGYRRTHGLTHMRHLELSIDGRVFSGEDTLATQDDTDKRQFDRMMNKALLQGIEFSIRFHLHPDIDATIDMGGTAVSLALKSNEIWVFRHDGSCTLSLDPSVYLERDRLKPRATKQIVLSGRILEYANRISWSLAKAQDTPTVLRDLETSPLPAL